MGRIMLNPKQYVCPVCKKKIEIKETIQKDAGGNYRVRGECPTCKRFIEWVAFGYSKEVRKAIEEYYGKK